MLRYFTTALLVSSVCTPILADQSLSQPQDLFQPGNKIKTGELPVAYPQSASYRLQGGGVFVTVDYLLWRWSQSLVPINLYTTSNSFASEFISSTVQTITLNPHYKSGFQVGLGCNMHGMDDWSAYAEYTWYQNQVNSTITTNDNQGFKRLYGNQFVSFYQSGEFSAKATLFFNSLDTMLQKNFYVGKKSTLNFGAGLKNIWITQKVDSTYNVVLEDRLPLGEVDVISSCSTKEASWGIGPKFNLDSNFLLGYGLKFSGDLSASFLYTKYTTPGNMTANLSNSFNGTVQTKYIGITPTYRFVPVTEASLGLGWGSYLYKNTFHIDLSASYDVNVFWDYTKLELDTAENMTLHGLNLQVRFDF